MEITANQKVFSIPELLEAILINLSLQDILINAQRVCRTWTAIIDSSSALQQHLFFTPTPRSSAAKSGWTKNPLLLKKFPAWFGDIRVTHRFYIPRPYKTHDNVYDVSHIKNSDWASCPDAYSRPEASWRRMLVMQPAVQLLKIVHANLDGKRWKRVRETREFTPAEGLRMGFLYDFVVEDIDETHTKFGLQWNMFNYEVDTEAREFYEWPEALIKRHEEKDSVILILFCAHMRSNGRKMEWKKGDLGTLFRSRRTC